MADLVSGLTFAILSGAIYTWSLALPASRTDVPGAAFMPKILAVLGVVCGILLCIRAIRSRMRSTAPEDGTGIPAQEYMRLSALVVVAGVYVFALKPLGFLASSALFLLAALFLLRERSILMLLVVPAGLTASVFFLFSELLNLRLPRGDLF